MTTQTLSSDAQNYASFADELISTCIISDPWVEGVERFRLEPQVLPAGTYNEFQRAIERIGKLYNEMTRILWDRRALLEESFYLTPWQQEMWLASGGHWHGIARADAFVVEDGSLRICELNADTPSGEPEAVILNHLRHRFHSDLLNPNAGFEEQFVRMVYATHRAALGEQASDMPTIGIIYPTDLPEDLSMIELYRTWFQHRGHTVILGSPYNLARAEDGALTLFGEKIEIAIRHYKTDWWSEREPVSVKGDDFMDPDPLEGPLRAILGAELAGKVAVVNPFGGVIAQNKLSMAFFHERIDLFSDESREAIRAYIPPTFRLIHRDQDEVLRERERWVLKSDYGCEGDEVIIGRHVSDEQWASVIQELIPERWIIQEYFQAAVDTNGLIPNYGLFLIGGKSGGIFTRFSSATTDYRALTAPTFVEQS